MEVVSERLLQRSNSSKFNVLVAIIWAKAFKYSSLPLLSQLSKRIVVLKKTIDLPEIPFVLDYCFIGHLFLAIV